MSTSSWTWLAGSVDGNQKDIFGQKGIAAAPQTSHIGSRYGHSMTVNPSTGSILVFGGWNSGSTDMRYFDAIKCNVIFGLGQFNDIWQWDPVTRYWTWLSGVNPYVEEAVAEYGTKGVPSAANMPDGRLFSAVCVHSDSGTVYVFGGSGKNSHLLSGYKLFIICF